MLGEKSRLEGNTCMGPEAQKGLLNFEELTGLLGGKE
jgi:hypothetical protein